MSNYRVTAKFQTKTSPVETILNLISFQEGDSYIVYSPAMDMAGYGKTEEEAIESFKVVLDEFVRYSIAKKTIFKELERLGWKVSGKAQKTVKPPSFDSLLQTNPQFQETARRVPFRLISQPLRIPEYA